MLINHQPEIKDKGNVILIIHIDCILLSEAFEKHQEEPALELTVSVYNINLGHNTELLEA